MHIQGNEIGCMSSNIYKIELKWTKEALRPESQILGENREENLKNLVLDNDIYNKTPKVNLQKEIRLIGLHNDEVSA